MPPSDAKLLQKNGPKQVQGKETFLVGDHPRGPAKATASIAPAADLRSWYGQQIPFNSIVAAGALVKSGNSYDQAGGFTKGR
jgi:chitinase